jgi:predicted RNase H-like HicB family nuclease
MLSERGIRPLTAGATGAAPPLIEIEREEDGRWIAEVPELPGVMAYGSDRATAVARVQALALRVLEERQREQSGIPHGAAGQVVQDDALLRAIKAGEETGTVSRDEVFRALEDLLRSP